MNARTWDRGFLTLGKLRGAPLRFHWSLPLGMLIFTRFEFLPISWLALLGLILVHEEGHAWLVRRARLKVVSIDVHGFGGECRYRGHISERAEIRIAWGGVAAQAIVLVIALVVRLAIGPPTSFAYAQLDDALIRINAFMIALNLIPIPGFDGHLAWRIFRRRSNKAKRAQTSRQATVVPLVLSNTDETSIKASIDDQIDSLARSHNQAHDDADK